MHNAKPIEIIDIECGLLSRVSQKIVATKWRIYKGKIISSPQDILCKSKRLIFEENQKWRIYKGKMFCQIGPLSRDRARILYLIILWLNPDGKFIVNCIYCINIFIAACTILV